MRKVTREDWRDTDLTRSLRYVGPKRTRTAAILTPLTAPQGEKERERTKLVSSFNSFQLLGSSARLTRGPRAPGGVERAREDEIRSVGGVGSNASEEARPKWAKFCTHVVQGMAKEWALGCVIPPLAAGRVSRNLGTVH